MANSETDTPSPTTETKKARRRRAKSVNSQHSLKKLPSNAENSAEVDKKAGSGHNTIASLRASFVTQKRRPASLVGESKVKPEPVRNMSVGDDTKLQGTRKNSLPTSKFSAFTLRKNRTNSSEENSGQQRRASGDVNHESEFHSRGTLRSIRRSATQKFKRKRSDPSEGNSGTVFLGLVHTSHDTHETLPPKHILDLTKEEALYLDKYAYDEVRNAMCIEMKELRKIKKYDKRTKRAGKGIFGVDLEQVLKNDMHTYNLKEMPEIPVFVKQCIDYFYDNPSVVLTAGIFRVSGGARKMKSYEQELNKEGKLDITDINCHDIANLLKLFIRSLPEPLLTFNLYEAFVKTYDYCELLDFQIMLLHRLILLLPEPNKALILHLMKFFNYVAEHSHGTFEGGDGNVQKAPSLSNLPVDSNEKNEEVNDVESNPAIATTTETVETKIETTAETAATITETTETIETVNTEMTTPIGTSSYAAVAANEKDEDELISTGNKMDARNLSLVIGPNLIRKKVQTDLQLEECEKIGKIIQIMIENQEVLSQVKGEVLMKLKQELEITEDNDNKDEKDCKRSSKGSMKKEKTSSKHSSNMANNGETTKVSLSDIPTTIQDEFVGEHEQSGNSD